MLSEPGCGGEEKERWTTSRQVSKSKAELVDGLDVEGERNRMIKNDFQTSGLGPWVDGRPFIEIGNTKGR